MQFFRGLVFAALVCGASAAFFRTAPDVSAQVARETQENIQIHDVFQSQEAKDDQTVAEVHSNHDLSQIQFRGGNWVVALDRDLKTKMLVEVSPRTALLEGIKDPCAEISCGSLTCPAGFSSTKVDGHCCPYCVNPDVKVEAAITGATGSNGGTASTFCPKVWCFPTMCTKAATAPTTTNGLCCDSCPA